MLIQTELQVPPLPLHLINRNFINVPMMRSMAILGVLVALVLCINGCSPTNTEELNTKVDRLTEENVSAFLERWEHSLEQLNYRNFDQFFTTDAKIHRTMGTGSDDRQVGSLSVAEFEAYFFRVFLYNPRYSIQRTNTSITIFKNGATARVEEDQLLEARYPMRTITSKAHLHFQVRFVDGYLLIAGLHANFDPNAFSSRMSNMGLMVYIVGTTVILLHILVQLTNFPLTAGNLFYAAFLALAVARALVYTPWGEQALPPDFRNWVKVLWYTAPYLLYLGIRVMFVDTFRLRWRHMVGFLALTGIVLGIHRLLAHHQSVAILTPHTPLWVQLEQSGLHLIFFVFYFLSLVVIIKDWRVDLVEARRKKRLIFFTLTLGYCLSRSVTSVVNVFWVVPYFELRLFIPIMLSAFFILIARKLDTSFFQNMGSPLQSVHPPKNDPKQSDDPVVRQLTHYMEVEKGFCNEKLTIARMAADLGMQEYQLRRRINNHLGYRNFNDFLNTYRINETAAQLTNAATVDKPILNIALDVGYRSMTTFNKAFKERFGMTPSQYRNQKGKNSLLNN